MAVVKTRENAVVPADWRSGAMATSMMGDSYHRAQGSASGHVGLLDYYMPKFYDLARGHVINKYHIGFYGPYVDEALHVMDQNSFSDKYDLSRRKLFPGTNDNFRKTLFNEWLEMCYEKDSGVLNMYWAAQSIQITSPTAETRQVMMDTTKQIQYPVVTGIQTDNTMTINVVDDPYLMWYNFFNALFNVQYSPLLLKPRSTLQKINVMVELFTEGITASNSKATIEERGNGKPCMTDLVIGQMFEFNSCITTAAPSISPSYNNATPYTFNVTLKYPNAFQGSFKDQLRYLRDNTTRGIDPSKGIEYNANYGQCTLKQVSYNPYGEYNLGFYEVDHSTWQKDKDNATFEAFQPKKYQQFIRSGQAAFRDSNFKYDMNGNRRR